MNGKNVLTIATENTRLVFSKAGGGFPTSVFLRYYDGSEKEIISGNEPMITATSEGTKLSPFLPAGFKIKKTLVNGAQRFEFNRLPWRDKNDRVINGLTLSLRYEAWPDGTMFVKTFFVSENVTPPDLGNFRMKVRLNFNSFDSVKWGLIGRLERPGNKTTIERYLDSGKARRFPEEILPICMFNCSGGAQPAAHVELFVEGNNSLSGNLKDAETRLSWEGKSPEVEWIFQKDEKTSGGYCWQWQNQWGWLMTGAPVKRRFPPLRMYHHNDTAVRYPGNKTLKMMADGGADALIIHEVWRRDSQDGGEPFDPAEMQRVLRQTKKWGMRTVLYSRGSEITLIEEYCDWFDGLLRKDVDGIYMDYGGPYYQNSYQQNKERFPGGRVWLRQHFMKLRKLRERVGNGLFLSHTGPLFSALGMTGGNVDCYVAGEGEKGVMVKDRPRHEHYSEAYSIPGSMWTAAFPAYGTSKMTPFLAAAGQSPHVPLGVQFPSTSLSHPLTPGINDLYLRALWKLWGLFRGETNVLCFTQYNSVGILKSDNPKGGVFLMVSSDRKIALVIATNFSPEPDKFKIRVDFKKAGFFARKAKRWLLTPNLNSPGKAMPQAVLAPMSATLEGYGVAGWFLSARKIEGEKRIKVFERKYPSQSKKSLDHTRKVELQKRLRNPGKAWPKLYFRVEMPHVPCVPGEKSLWDTFYKKQSIQFGVFKDDGKFLPLGWIGQEGLLRKEPGEKGRVQPGANSKWIELNRLLPAGEHKAALHTIHPKLYPFHSMIRVRVSPKSSADTADAYLLEYMNELEDHCSFLRWTVKLTKNSKKH